MRLRTGAFLCGGLLAAALILASCGTPAEQLEARVDHLSKDVQPVVREAIWAHGNPFVWTQQDSLVIEALSSDYRHGYKPLTTRKTYTLDLKSRRMRIDDEGAQTVALYDGQTWRVFAHGQEIKIPQTVTQENAGYAYMFEAAAGEMRTMRLFFCLPFDLLDEGVALRAAGQVQSPGGSSNWNVLKVTFDPATTGRLPGLAGRPNTGDRMFVYFDQMSKRVDRALFTFADTPFDAIAYWGEWSDYRKLANGMIIAYRYDFSVTNASGAADEMRRLSILVDKAAFNVGLPVDVYSSPTARPGAIEDQSRPAEIKPASQEPINVGR